MTQPVPPFARSTPEAGVAPTPAQGTPMEDPTGGFGYSPMSEDSPEDHLLKKPQVRAAYVRVAHPLPKSKIPVSKMNPEQAAAYRAAHEESKQKSTQWLQENPSSAQNIVDHWNQTTPEHKSQGMSWYADAHHAANVIARDHGITTAQAAGLIANYSPQQHWAQNLRMASLAAGGQVIGGKKDPNNPDQEGFMASASQAAAAKRILDGEHYSTVLGGKKINDFAHLIEHGTDADDKTHVVVDRHALGVAHGGYADDGVYTHSKVSAGQRKDGSSPAYDEVAQHYRDAADIISKQEGYPVAPHQVQAATWLTRQRLNADGGYTNSSNAPRVQKVAEAAVNKWNAYAAERHPDLVNKVPGTGFSASVGQGGMSNPEQFTQAPAKVAAWVRTASRPKKNFVYDPIAEQYKTSKLDAKFSCNCGKTFAPTGFHRCACGQSWASFTIGSQDKTAAKAILVVRQVSEHRDRILAKKAAKSNKCEKCSDQAVTKVLHAEGMAYVPACEKHKEAVKKSLGSEFSGFRAYAEMISDPEDVQYNRANSSEQHPEREQTESFDNEYTEGLKPHEGDPFYVRNTESDPAPVVLDKEASMTPPFVREAIAAPAPQKKVKIDPYHPWDHLDQPQTIPDDQAASPVPAKIDPYNPWGHLDQKTPSRVQGKKTMAFNEEDYKNGWLHAEANNALPKVASRDFLLGYSDNLKEIVADRAPGWDTVAPAFAKPEPGVNPTMSDYTDATPKTDDGQYHEVRKELGDKLDRDNAAGQSRDDQGSGINRPTLDVDGWKGKSSNIDLSHVHTAALAREIARRSGVEKF